MTTYMITGAARGIGLEFVRQLLARGERVIAATRSATPSLDALGAQHGGNLIRMTLDTGNEQSISAARSALGGTVPAIDVLINNAGIYSTLSPNWNPALTGFDAITSNDLLETFRINAIGPILVTRHFVELLAAGKHARLVNISSRLGGISEKTTGGDYAYCASKAALNMYTRALAVDLAPRGIIAMAMTPGWVQTDMGGSNAALTPEQSVRGMLGVIDRLTPADAGRFVDQDGVDQPW